MYLVGVEITASAKYASNPGDLTQSEGRVQLRFFNTGQKKDDQIKFTLEPLEAYSASIKLLEIADSFESLRLEMPSHSFPSAGGVNNRITTHVAFERNENGKYALIASRNGNSHRV